MKNIIALVLFYLALSSTNGKAQLLVNSSQSNHLKPATEQQDKDFSPGRILIKFKDEIIVNTNKTNGFASSGIASVDSVLERFQTREIEKLFTKTERLIQKQMLKTFSGEVFEQPSLHNIYKLTIPTTINIYEAVQALGKLSMIEYAEPDFIFTAMDTIPNDPFYAQQWGLTAINAPAAWLQSTGDSTQIIGILDTGVDWLHPDLVSNIKINWAEMNGVAGYDDDGNGYIDDVRGWDFVNQDANPADDNSHGTHVAGIAAAVTNNSIGIAGTSWGAKILPIKVLQSSGRGNTSDIAAGIYYAATNGATIINMSFGGYAESQTIKNVLQYAYAFSVLVAAAGNDGKAIGPCSGCAPMFPAAYNLVLGVEATQQFPNPSTGYRPGFSNYDQDGPVFSEYLDGFNYELKAPGDMIMSCFPNGNYRFLSGTSMATPIAAGSIAIYKALFPNRSQEILWGDFINTLGNTLNIQAALNTPSVPKLNLVNYNIVDTLAGCDRDGRPDAGETFLIWYTVKNTWGYASNVIAKLRLDELEDPAIAQVIDNVGIVGNISAYATLTNEGAPFKVHISDSAVNNRDIVFNYEIFASNGGDTARGDIVLTVQRGTEVGGVLTSNTTWTSDNLYIVSNHLRVSDGVTLTIEPGTTVLFESDKAIDVRGSVIAVGTPQSPINFAGSPYGSGRGFKIDYYSSNNASVDFRYCRFHDIQDALVLARYSFSRPQIIYDNVFENLGPKWWNNMIDLTGEGFLLERNVFVSNSITSALGIPVGPTNTFKNNIFIGNSLGSEAAAVANFGNTQDALNFIDNSIFNNRSGWEGQILDLLVSGTPDYISLANNYWGSTDTAMIHNRIIDFIELGYGPVALLSPILQQPSRNTHGHVWKIERTIPDPIGLQSVRFFVYFNRPMDIRYTPFLTFGVREPYTQNIVQDSAYWSPDSTMWSANFQVKLSTGDGINTLRVAGAKDPEGFEIPIENVRYKILIDAAGAASSDFSAIAGLGKVTLEWTKPGTPDFLGYNMYRFANLTDTTYTDTVMINNTLLTDTTFVDFNVLPGKKYYYQYRVVRTDLTETDPSRIVSSIPLTAAMGDANGDFSVNVLDIISIVAYILGQNPQPFIFEAADINNDDTINVLDIIGVVNIILGGGTETEIIASTGTARIELIGNRIDLSTDIPVGGIQFRLSGSGVAALQFNPDDLISQYEVVHGIQGDSSRMFILFSLTGTTIPMGQHTIGTFQGIHSGISITEAIIADAKGNNVITSVYDNGTSLIPTDYYLHQNYPNPFNAMTTIQYGVPEKTEVTITIYNILGQTIRSIALGEVNPGRYQTIWDGRNDHGKSVASGVYIYRLHSPKFNQFKKFIMIK